MNTSKQIEMVRVGTGFRIAQTCGLPGLVVEGERE
jgi:hypothetical protein